MSEVSTSINLEPLSISGFVESRLREAARVIREDVLAEVVAMGDDFPRIEVAVALPDDVDRQTIGAVALGHRYLETKLIPGIIVEDNRRDVHIDKYSAVLLTPEGMKRVRGSLVVKKFSATGYGVEDIYPNRDGHNPDEDALWLAYGMKAAQKVEQIKSHLTEDKA